MLIKRSEARAGRQRQAAAYAGLSSGGLDRRAFLKQAGITGVGLSALGTIPLTTIRPAAAGPVNHQQPVTRVKNICTHCSVGCSVTAEVQNGVWVGQEPTWDSPINRGTHCAKGAAVRELVHGDRRIKYPMKLVNGQWTRMTWDAAVNEIGDKLMAVRQASGPDSVFWLGSAKFSNEGAYLFRKYAAFWGTNNVDHQARICHSTTVAGVANTWGYGAQTNSYNDIRNSKTMIIMGGNPAEAHPVSLLSGKEQNRANLIVIDPRFTRTAAHASEFMRIRPGTDIPIIWGLLWHIFQNNWEDREFIRQRVYGMDEVRAEVAKWTPAEVLRVTGVPEAQMRKVAEMFATQKPSTLIWCMGATQKTVGTANVRAYSILLLATGNVGKEGTGANIFRGHCNVQGATDFGLDVTTLPAYYGLDENAWRHWSRVWGVSYESMVARFDSTAMMTTPGIPTTRYFDAVTMPVNAQTGLAQRDNLKAMVVFGHGGNTVTRMPEAVKGLEKLDLLVVADPHPTTFAVLANRRENTYLLPICTQFECDGSRTASNRSVQWGAKVVDPIFESKNDYEALYRLAGAIDAAAARRNMTFRMQEEVFKGFEIRANAPVAESILREINRGAISTGYTGQSPERLKLHMQHQDKFDLVTLRAKADAPAEIAGDFYGLPWPCWGTPQMRHPGTHILYNTNLHVKQGGGTFRARFGVERNGVSLLAEGSHSQGSELTDGYPEFTTAVMARLGWDAELTEAEKASIARQGGSASWATDLSMGIIRVTMEHGVMAYGNAKARANAWNLPDPIPVHREPIYTPRTDLIAQYPTLPDRRAFRMPHLGQSVQNRAKDLAPNFPIILSSGRLVEYEGGGEETRSNKWLAELQQDMFVEINPQDAASRNIRDGAWVLVNGPEMPAGKATRMKALVTERVGPGVAWMPFHFAGWFMQEDQRSKYPQGTDPIVLGESVNAITTYGYDPVTFMQETKVTLCQIRAA